MNTSKIGDYSNDNVKFSTQIITANKIKSSTDQKINESLIIKFNEIESILLELANNQHKIVNLCNKYINSSLGFLDTINKVIVSFVAPKKCFWNNAQACGCTARAIMQQFTMRKTKKISISSFDELCQELQKPTDELFLIGINRTEFKQGMEIKNFPGHAFTVIKLVADRQIGYRIAQSYMGQYHLKDFLAQKTLIFAGFDSFKKDVLDPLKPLLERQGAWTDLECENYRKITSIYPSDLIGYHPDTTTQSLDVMYEAIPFEDYKTISNPLTSNKIWEMVFKMKNHVFSKMIKDPFNTPPCIKFKPMPNVGFFKDKKPIPQKSVRMEAMVLVLVVAWGALAIYQSSHKPKKNLFAYSEL